MVAWLMWGTLLVVWFSFLFILSFLIDKRRRMLLGVTVPRDKLQDPVVQSLIDRYRKQKKRFTVSGLILSFPILLFETFAWIYSYFNVYLVVFFLWLYWMIFQGNRKMKAIKKEQGWQVGEKQAVYVDTNLSVKDLSHKQPNMLWLLPALILCFEPLLSIHPMLVSAGWIMAGTSLFLWILAVIVFVKLKRTPPKVYTGDTKVDQRINDTWKARWMTLTLILTYYFLLFNSLIHRLITGSGGETGLGFMIIILAGSTLPLVPLLIMHRMRVKLVEDLRKNRTLLEVDEDDYWIGGMIYYNPNVKKTFVSTRIGIGSSINLGTTAGKWLLGITVLLTIGLVLGSWAYVIAEEFVDPKILWDEEKLYIQALGYQDQIRYEEIVEISTMEELGKRTKTNGTGTADYARGNFHVQGYGKSRVYVFHDTPIIIAIDLEDLTVFYNEPTEEATRTILKELRKRTD